MYAYVSFIVDVKKHHRCVPKDNEFLCLANGRSDQGGCRAKWNNCIPQDITVGGSLKPNLSEILL